jgi:hypothetical protein
VRLTDLLAQMEQQSPAEPAVQNPLLLPPSDTQRGRSLPAAP